MYSFCLWFPFWIGKHNFFHVLVISLKGYLDRSVSAIILHTPLIHVLRLQHNEWIINDYVTRSVAIRRRFDKWVGSFMQIESILFCDIALFLALSQCSHAKIECCRLQSSSTCTMEKSCFFSRCMYCGTELVPGTWGSWFKSRVMTHVSTNVWVYVVKQNKTTGTRFHLTCLGRIPTNVPTDK